MLVLLCRQNQRKNPVKSENRMLRQDPQATLLLHWSKSLTFWKTKNWNRWLVRGCEQNNEARQAEDFAVCGQRGISPEANIKQREVGLFAAKLDFIDSASWPWNHISREKAI